MARPFEPELDKEEDEVPDLANVAIGILSSFTIFSWSSPKLATESDLTYIGLSFIRFIKLLDLSE